MECETKLSVEYDTKGSTILSGKSRIVEVLELVFTHPEEKNEMQNMLSSFWDKHKNCISEEKVYSEFDVLGMYALYYAYKRNGPTQLAVSRSIYSYRKQLNSCAENRNAMLNCPNNCFVSSLCNFANFNPSHEDILVMALSECIFGGNLSLSRFLVKFGLVEFPSDANEESKKIVETLVGIFNGAYSSRRDDNTAEEDKISIQADDVFYEMQEDKNGSFRRLTFVLCYICIVAEYEALNELEIRYGRWKGIKTTLCFLISTCLNRFIKMTTEAIVTFKDVDKFLSTILSQQLNEAVRLSLQETTREMFREMHDYYNPRTLKDLARSKIREYLRNSEVLPKSVYKLPIPMPLKKFVSFEEKEIWQTLKTDQLAIHAMYKIHRRAGKLSTHVCC